MIRPTSRPNKTALRGYFVQALPSVPPPHNPLQVPSNLEDSEGRDESGAALTLLGHKAVRSHVQSSREHNSRNLALSLAGYCGRNV